MGERSPCTRGRGRRGRSALGVEHAGRVIGAHVLAQLLHHVDHAADGAGGRARRVARARRAGPAWHGRRGTGSWSRPPAAAFFCRYSWGLIVGDIGPSLPGPAQAIETGGAISPGVACGALSPAPSQAYNAGMKHALRLLAAAAALPLAAAMAQAPAQDAAPPARVEAAPPSRDAPTRPSSAYAPRTPAPASTNCAWAARPSRSPCKPKTGGAAYEVKPAEGARGTAPASTSNDTNGSRVWNVLKF
jgi:hypothetical protein